mmetsp:Transcript_17677/g.49745  ORF Transcript_17677/g.49745 Transcript_17677/m.49745 type:complete len:342 (+) Transcript_17677:75-1100(+)|eukprot:CAMPEP_0119119750 /NCGR_PEP_ID=MMETSP1310-20130426/1100_1 /TAXON_ID=464262 /ORGANISM="Genus nov. species nov., Strain RCC2339" /LENGTH=341 /DNA_ID=CAMNT_0007109197 /DNA_START=53 /DNA_END=1078 /DNA_ORIENTATION=+
MGYHPVIVVFAAIGAVALALLPFQPSLGDGGCCSGNKWQEHDAEYKEAILWEKIIKDRKSGGWPGLGQGVLFTESMDPTFDRVADDLPLTRFKVIHSVGSVAKLHFNVTNAAEAAKYTGLFRGGAKHGLIRLSPAAEPEPENWNNCDPQCGFIPGASLKFLRTGKASANLLAMYSLVGQPSFNFFENNFTNQPPLACEDVRGSLRLLYNKFRTASQWPNVVGMTAMARFDEDGNEYGEYNFPFQAILVPNPTISFPDEPSPGWSDQTLFDQLSSIPVGTALYKFVVKETPESAPVELAELIITSTFTSSEFGDDNLFFQHVRAEEDNLRHPEFVDSLPPQC